jgi:hypothetical protein
MTGTPSAVLVDGEQIALGVISIDVGLSISVRLESILGELPAPGDEVVLRTFEAVSGRREYAATVQAVSTQTLVVTDVTLVSAFQQRAIGRVSTAIQVSLEYRMENEELLEVAAPIQGTIVDLSATGIRVLCAVPLDQGYRFGFDLPSGVDDFTIVAEVRRREEVPQGHLHGCRLIGTTQREADALQQFVLDQQSAQGPQPPQD